MMTDDMRTSPVFLQLLCTSSLIISPSEIIQISYIGWTRRRFLVEIVFIAFGEITPTM